jgi:peptidoglycan/LPS O-acetylase OafA/YrhL
MEPTVKSNYDLRIDQIRAFACFIVATVHVSVPSWTNSIKETGYYFDSVILSVIKTGWVGVPIFLFISGYSLALKKINPNNILDIKQFAINRILRLLPLWAICVVLIANFNSLEGTKVINLLLFQAQDIPPSSPFNIAWTLQLEMACYFFFPIFFFALCKKDKKQIIIFYLFLLSIRVLLFYNQSGTIWTISYGTIFGGATIFLTGMIVTTLKPLQEGLKAKYYFYSGIFLMLIFCTLVNSSGGYQNPKGFLLHNIFIFMPEILSIIIFLILRGFLTDKASRKPDNFISKLSSYFGKISYSAYLLSLFVNDAVSRFIMITPSGWSSFILYLIIYFTILILVASLSFYAIENPFLQLRKKYL